MEIVIFIGKSLIRSNLKPAGVHRLIKLFYNRYEYEMKSTIYNLRDTRENR